MTLNLTTRETGATVLTKCVVTMTTLHSQFMEVYCAYIQTQVSLTLLPTLVKNPKSHFLCSKILPQEFLPEGLWKRLQGLFEAAVEAEDYSEATSYLTAIRKGKTSFWTFSV